jgi:anti-anti-sigma factor
VRVTRQPLSGPAVLTSSFTHEGDVVVVALDGESDCCTTEALGRALAEAAGLGGSGIVVDLQGVTFMDVATVRVLFLASVAAAERSHTFALRAPTTGSRRLLELCGARGLVEMAAA